MSIIINSWIAHTPLVLVSLNFMVWGGIRKNALYG